VAWSVYSKRLLEVNNATGWTIMYVPLGYVAIVKFVSIVNPTGTAGLGALLIHNGYVYRSSVPGGSQVVITGLHAVANEQEQVGINLPATGWSAHVSGFLLRQEPDAPGILMPSEHVGNVSVEELVEVAERRGVDPVG
jgi:hypothetical protein